MGQGDQGGLPEEEDQYPGREAGFMETEGTIQKQSIFFIKTLWVR